MTGLVKDALGLNTEGYDDFWGDRYENGLTDVWSLSWSGSDGDLSVEALDDGTVISYRLGQTYSAYSAFPTFPGGDADAAAQAARDFWTKSWGWGDRGTGRAPERRKPEQRQRPLLRQHPPQRPALPADLLHHCPG